MKKKTGKVCGRKITRAKDKDRLPLGLDAQSLD